VHAVSIREVAASIAHEVNQPLTAIVTIAESCLSWLSSDPQDMARLRKAAERIVRHGLRASEVLKSMVAQLEVANPVMSNLDLNEVVRDIVELMSAELCRSDVVLQVELCPRLGWVRGNRIQLQQVVLNLVKNGIEAMSESAIRPCLLRVSSAMNGGWAVIAVQDSGRGIDSASAERMFEPFFTTKSQGTGVGLSICRSIVEAHGGVISASPGETMGSVFQFTVPLISQRVAAEN
jgi:signal transduction histidine kinase